MIKHRSAKRKAPNPEVLQLREDLARTQRSLECIGDLHVRNHERLFVQNQQLREALTRAMSLIDRLQGNSGQWSVDDVVMLEAIRLLAAEDAVKRKS